VFRDFNLSKRITVGENNIRGGYNILVGSRVVTNFGGSEIINNYKGV